MSLSNRDDEVGSSRLTVKIGTDPTRSVDPSSEVDYTKTPEGQDFEGVYFL